MECIKCGNNKIAAGVTVCNTCGLDLTTLERAENGMVHPVYERFLEFRHAAERCVSGAWSMDEYKKFLDEISFKMAQKEQEIRELEIPPGALEEFRKELETGFEGIDLYNRALVNFRQYASTNDPVYLRAGIECAWMGNEKINDARKINRAARAQTPDE